MRLRRHAQSGRMGPDKRAIAKARAWAPTVEKTGARLFNPMMTDTEIGGPDGRFPQTRRSAVAALRGEDHTRRQRAQSTIVLSYWKPVYKYLRLKWKAPNEEAKDLTQGFFAAAFEDDYFRPYDAARGSFRTFLRTCVDGFVMNSRKADQRLKRGGEALTMSLDFEAAESEFQIHGPPVADEMEQYFHREWLRSLTSLAVRELRDRCESAGKLAQFRLFERYDLQDDQAIKQPTYAALAEEFEISVTQVTNHLAWARREFRAALLDQLRDLTGSDAEFREEAQRLLGSDPP